MPSFAITSIGHDRPGIVAAVTRVLLDRGCNLEDTAMSILRGQFAMVMVVAAPAGTESGELERELLDRTAELDLVISVRDVHPLAGATDAFGSRCTVVVYGPDHPGIVHVVADRLAALDVNIVDVTTRISGRSSALYSMVMEAVLPPGVDAATVERHLADAVAGDELTVRVSPVDADLF